MNHFAIAEDFDAAFFGGLFACVEKPEESSGIAVKPEETGPSVEGGGGAGGLVRVVSTATTAAMATAPHSSVATRQPTARRVRGDSGAVGSVDGIGNSSEAPRARRMDAIASSS